MSAWGGTYRDGYVILMPFVDLPAQRHLDGEEQGRNHHNGVFIITMRYARCRNRACEIF